MQFRILYQDPHLIAIDKPAGYHVHPPEDESIQISQKRNCMALLRKQINQYLHPAHRIDCPTAGVVLFALDVEASRRINLLFQERRIRKTYYCVVRGWAPEEDRITRALAGEKDGGVKLDAETVFARMARIELPHAVGRYSTARYSLLHVEPLTGRLHQIRRHLAGAGYPLVGDTVHGDGEHNRHFRNQLQIPGLLLKAQALSFEHPMTQEPIYIESRWSGRWHRIFDLFGVCPLRQEMANRSPSG